MYVHLHPLHFPELLHLKQIVSSPIHFSHSGSPSTIDLVLLSFRIEAFTYVLRPHGCFRWTFDLYSQPGLFRHSWWLSGSLIIHSIITSLLRNLAIFDSILNFSIYLGTYHQILSHFYSFLLFLKQFFECDVLRGYSDTAGAISR